MSALLLLLAGGLFGAPEPEKPAPLRYLKEVDGKFVLESEVTETRGDQGVTYVSRTERGKDTLTLTLRFDRKNQVTAAEAVLGGPRTKQSASVVFQNNTTQVKRPGGVADLVKVGANPVVTSAPDWSDIFQLVRRYDGAKGGRQEFPGLWIRPDQPPRVIPFTIERVGDDTVRVKEKPLKLDRYRIKLRSGNYLAWADNGRVLKLMVPSKPSSAVVLEGYEEATRGLGQ